MAVLNSKQVLQEKKTTDTNAVTDLKFTHRALSDVSCLIEFQKLEKLDLAVNNLSSLEGLKSCVSLKWLSVVQNKLESLKGIEGLVNLTVLNAGKNKLRSMEEVGTLVSLRALILNDNEIVSLCRLDQMKDLNTLVLSRNPIRRIGDTLAKIKSLTKLSLSNCELQSIDSSFKNCTELKELRLAHNEIKTLPSELARNSRILNLDLGNNLITKWSELKVLSSMVNLRNLNLLGNPVAAKDMLAKKIKRLVPSLQVFNARPMDKLMKNEDGGNKPLVPEEDVTDHNVETANRESSLKKKSTHKRQKTNELLKESASDRRQDGTKTEKEPSTKSKVKLDIIDDGEVPFGDLFTADASESDINRSEKRDADSVSGLVTFPKKKRKAKKQSSALQPFSSELEIGLGGSSAWD